MAKMAGAAPPERAQTAAPPRSWPPRTRPSGLPSAPAAEGKEPLLAVACGFGSFALGFCQLRPNRISSGTALRAWGALPAAEIVLLLVPLVLCLSLSLAATSRKTLSIACGVSGNLLVCLVFAFSGKAARVLGAAGGPTVRVSIGMGAWILVLAGYILVLFALRDDSLRGGAKTLFSLGGIAVLLLMAASGLLDEISVIKEYAARRDRFLDELASHLLLACSSVGAAVVIGVPLGVLAFRRRAALRPIFFVVNTVQTVPSLALFGILIAPLAFLSRGCPFLRTLGVKGVGAAPALVALTLYALLPIVRNTYTSLKVMDPAIPEAGRGMGMGMVQLLLRVEVPMSVPIIMSGVRISLVQAIGNTTVAALIGAGGFGVFVFQGLGQAVPDLILLGTLPVIILAILTDRVMQVLVRLSTPKGLSKLLESAG